MTPDEKRARLDYLRYRMRVVADAALFIYSLKKIVQSADLQRISEKHYKMHIDDEDSVSLAQNLTSDFNRMNYSKTCWLVLLSVFLWFNLISAPLIILWPEITDQTESKTLYYTLWLNETCFLLDMIRKFFDPPKGSRTNDSYEIAVNYIKSTLILDLLASLPQVASDLNNSFVPIKIVRIYQVGLLHYPLEVLVDVIYAQQEKRKIFVIVYALSTLCQIILLLHYLAVVWLWVGSESFLTYEEGFEPWQFSIEDFNDQSKTNLYCFSVYWVCTVLTTVGYGDYAGTTSLERVYTFMLEFFGIVVFSVFQIAVDLVVNYDPSFDAFITDQDNAIIEWLMDLEISNHRQSIP